MPEPVPAVEGWFTDDALVGGRCEGCGTWTFPRAAGWCPNPGCTSTDEAASHELSRRATVWSYATNHFEPPPPAVVTAPYTVVAATLAEEGLTILGLLADGASPDDLRVGSEVEVLVESLATDEDGTPRTVWKWRPVASASDGTGEVAA